MVFCNFVVPFVLLGIRKLRTITTAMIASVCVLIGMWLERYLIVVPTLGNPRLTAASGVYAPTWIEFAITAATFAAMIVLYLIFSKLFPIIAVWEFKPHPVEEELGVYLMADFREQAKLEAAILALKAAGIGAADMDVFSEEPVEFRRGILDRPSRMSLVAVLGAIADRRTGDRRRLRRAAQLPADHRRHADLLVLGHRRHHL